tara:strand:- start:41 stop:376 length:336 start_codon:yes stop_codon:yes gene_type:complete
MGFTTFSRRDAQRFRKVYPRIRKTPRFFTISDEQMSIESTKVSLNNEVQGEFNFQLEYNQIPTVQLSAETSSDDQGMVNVFITQLTTKFVKFETSAPFTGQIHIQIFKVGS